MSRYTCERCKEVYHIVFGVNEEEHVCKDIRQRVARREKQVKAVIGILNEMMPPPTVYCVTIDITEMGDAENTYHCTTHDVYIGPADKPCPGIKPNEPFRRSVAENIVHVLANMGVDND